MQTTASLQSHRKAFCLGSILPDIKPSFITRRHEFYGTFEDVKNRMKELADIRPDESNQRVYWRRFGEVIHYMADYFTFPHNKTYTGSFSQHNHYEKVLKNRLKECIQQGEAHAYLEPAIRFADFSTLIDYIEATHEKYLNKLRSVEEDIRFILNMCFQVVQGLIQICIGNKNFAGAIQFSQLALFVVLLCFIAERAYASYHRYGSIRRDDVLPSIILTGSIMITVYIFALLFGANAL
jgi:hypothetical protein